MGTKDMNQTGKATEDMKVTAMGKGKGKVKGKVLIIKPQGEMISLVQLLCSCRRKCQKQSWTWGANKSGYI
jgi:hypothetical protein